MPTKKDAYSSEPAKSKAGSFSSGFNLYSGENPWWQKREENHLPPILFNAQQIGGQGQKRPIGLLVLYALGIMLKPMSLGALIGGLLGSLVFPALGTVAGAFIGLGIGAGVGLLVVGAIALYRKFSRKDHIKPLSTEEISNLCSESSHAKVDLLLGNVCCRSVDNVKVETTQIIEEHAPVSSLETNLPGNISLATHSAGFLSASKVKLAEEPISDLNPAYLL